MGRPPLLFCLSLLCAACQVGPTRASSEARGLTIRELARAVVQSLEKEAKLAHGRRLTVTTVSNESGGRFGEDLFKDRLKSEIRRSRAFKYGSKKPPLPGDFRQTGRLEDWGPPDFYLKARVSRAAEAEKWRVDFALNRERGGSLYTGFLIFRYAGR